jgi:hypothetical protein
MLAPLAVVRRRAYHAFLVPAFLFIQPGARFTECRTRGMMDAVRRTDREIEEVRELFVPIRGLASAAV